MCYIFCLFVFLIMMYIVPLRPCHLDMLPPLSKPEEYSRILIQLL